VKTARLSVLRALGQEAIHPPQTSKVAETPDATALLRQALSDRQEQTGHHVQVALGECRQLCDLGVPRYGEGGRVSLLLG